MYLRVDAMLVVIQKKREKTAKKKPTTKTMPPAHMPLSQVPTLTGGVARSMGGATHEQL